MSQKLLPTPYADVNEVLHHFLERIREAAEDRLVGMYLIGSLALGDFDPQSSDIDFVVVTNPALDASAFNALKQMHADFAAGGSPWAQRIEAVYVDVGALNRTDDRMLEETKYPQLEQGTELFRDVLEKGWVFQHYTLREKGGIVFGPDPRRIAAPVHVEDMVPAVRSIAKMWLDAAENDPDWLDWLSERKWQAFVVQTVCRMLYSLKTGSVTSKPAAAAWAQQTIGAPWDAFIRHTMARKEISETVPPSELSQTIQWIQFTHDQTETDPADG